MSIYLFDTNYLIYLIDEKSDPQKRKEVLQDFAQKLKDENSRFILTSLVRYEVLRGIEWENREKLELFIQKLSQFKPLEITNEISDFARDLYRFDEFNARQTGQNKNLEKRKFDMFHYATAHIYNLEILSKDSDIDKIKNLKENMIKSQEENKE